MEKKTSAGMALGAVLGSILGMLSSHPSKTISKGREWVDKAKDMGESLLNEVKHFQDPEGNHNTPPFVAGALMGLLLGASAALLLTPKTGKQLRNQLSKHYGDIVDHAHDYMDQLNSSEPVRKAKKGIKRAAKAVKSEKDSLKKTAKRVKNKIKKAVR